MRYVLLFAWQDKSVPHSIGEDFYEAHKMMESTLEELETANATLEQCQEKVLHEDQLRCSAASMTAAQYESLRQPFVEKDGHEEESAIMHWLQLSVNAVNLSPGGNEQLQIQQIMSALSFSLLPLKWSVNTHLGSMFAALPERPPRGLLSQTAADNRA